MTITTDAAPSRASRAARTVVPARTLGWGMLVPDRVGDQPRPRADPRHHRRVDRRAHRASDSAHRVGPDDTTASMADAGRPRRPRPGRRPGRRRSTCSCWPPPPPDRICPATAATVQHELGHEGRGLRPQRRLLRLRPRAARRAPRRCARRASTTCWSSAPTGFAAFADPSDRTHRRALRRRRRRPPAGRGRRRPDGPRARSASTSAATAARSTTSRSPTARRYVHMDGREVFRRATRGMVESCAAALARAGATADDVDLFVPHQANLRIIEAAAGRLGLPTDRVVRRHRPLRQHLGRRRCRSRSAEAADDGRITPGGDRPRLRHRRRHVLGHARCSGGAHERASRHGSRSSPAPPGHRRGHRDRARRRTGHRVAVGYRGDADGGQGDRRRGRGRRRRGASPCSST